MAQGKKISELTEVSSVTDNDEFLFVDKEGSGANSGIGGSNVKIKFSDLKMAITDGMKGEPGMDAEKGQKGEVGDRGIDGGGAAYFDQSPSDGDSIYYMGSGNLGLGTDAPSAKLDVSGAIKSTGLNVQSDTASISLKTYREGNYSFVRLGNATSSKADILVANDTAGNFSFFREFVPYPVWRHWHDDSQIQFLINNILTKDGGLLITSAGNSVDGNNSVANLGNAKLGIFGNTTEAAKMKLRDYRPFDASLGQGPEIHFQSLDNTGTPRTAALIKSEAFDDIKNDLVFGTSDGLGGAKEQMRITSSGNVGIGTSLPTYAKLAIRGGGGYDDITRQPMKTQLEVYTSDEASAIQSIQRDNNNAASDIHFWGNDFIFRSVNGTGNVGIGTDAPTRVLDIDAKDSRNVLRLLSSASDENHPHYLTFARHPNSKSISAIGAIQNVGDAYDADDNIVGYEYGRLSHHIMNHSVGNATSETRIYNKKWYSNSTSPQESLVIGRDLRFTGDVTNEYILVENASASIASGETIVNISGIEDWSKVQIEGWQSSHGVVDNFRGSQLRYIKLGDDVHEIVRASFDATASTFTLKSPVETDYTNVTLKICQSYSYKKARLTIVPSDRARKNQFDNDVGSEIILQVYQGGDVSPDSHNSGFASIHATPAKEVRQGYGATDLHFSTREAAAYQTLGYTTNNSHEAYKLNPAMVIKYNDTIGIGTTSPKGIVSIRGNNSGDKARITFQGDGNGVIGSVRGEVIEKLEYDPVNYPGSTVNTKGDLTFYTNSYSQTDLGDTTYSGDVEKEAFRLTTDGGMVHTASGFYRSRCVNFVNTTADNTKWDREIKFYVGANMNYRIKITIDGLSPFDYNGTAFFKEYEIVGQTETMEGMHYGHLLEARDLQASNLHTDMKPDFYELTYNRVQDENSPGGWVFWISIKVKFKANYRATARVEGYMSGARTPSQQSRTIIENSSQVDTLDGFGIVPIVEDGIDNVQLPEDQQYPTTKSTDK